jgi:hypothetical protein
MTHLRKAASGDAGLKMKLLISLPIIAYGVSYLVLALYHGKIFIFTTIVHEGGTHTLTRTIFYASHFLVHVPVHTVLAFLFTGTFLCLTGESIAAPYCSMQALSMPLF